MAALASARPSGLAMENSLLYDSEQLEGLESCSNMVY